MVRIFLPLAGVSILFLIVAMVLGLQIEDPKSRSLAVQATVQYHFLAAVSALVFAMFVHAVVLTYFMGTGRWIEETSNAYQLDGVQYHQSKKIKYRTIPAMVICFVLLVTAGALGAAADPASPLYSKGFAGQPASTIHLIVAITAVAGHLFTMWLEFLALERNGEIVNEVIAQVRRIRVANGLPV